MSRFTSTKVINSRWRNNDFIGAAGSSHTFPDAFHDEFLVDWAQQIADGSIIITETPTTGNIQMATLTVGDIVLTGTATGFPGAPTIVGTSPINVVTATGTSTVSLSANYSTTSHLHTATYQPLGTYITEVNGTAPIAASTTTAGISTVSLTASYSTSTHDHSGVYVTSVAGTAPISASTTTAGAATVSVSTGVTSATVALGNHLHAGTYITAVNGTAPITASTDTTGIVTVELSASYASSTHTHATSSITSGNFVATLAAGTGVTVTGADANAAAKTVAIGQAVATSDAVTFASVNKLAITAPATSATLAIANAKTLTVSNTMTLTGVDSSSANIGNGGALVPAGVVHIYMGANTSLPTGWLLCDGTAVSRTTYATLFGVISTNFGTGDGSTTFNLPDLTGNLLVGSSGIPSTSFQAGTTDAYANASWTHAHSHSHVTNPAATTSGGPSATTFVTLTGSVVASSTHTHSTDIAATTSDTDATNSPTITVKRTRVNYIIKW